MIQFINDSLIMSLWPDAGVFVVDADVQATWLTGESRYFAEAFPKLHKQVQKLSYQKLLREGTCMLFEQDGYKIAVLFTRKNRRTTEAQLQVNFQNALIDLFNKVPPDIYLHSPIVGRLDKCFTEYQLTLSRLINQEKAHRRWFVYTQEGYGHAFNY